jgi:hypothetical protein
MLAKNRLSFLLPRGKSVHTLTKFFPCALQIHASLVASTSHLPVMMDLLWDGWRQGRLLTASSHCLEARQPPSLQKSLQLLLLRRARL